MDPVTVELSSPIEHNGKTIISLTFNEATAGDAAASDLVTGEMTKTLAILASMSGQPLQVMRKIKMRDITKITASVAALMGNEDTQLESGSTSSS